LVESEEYSFTLKLRGEDKTCADCRLFIKDRNYCRKEYCSIEPDSICDNPLFY